MIIKHHLPKFRNIRFAATLENSVNTNITIPTHTIRLPISSKPPSVSSNPLPRIMRFTLVNCLFRTSMAIFYNPIPVQSSWYILSVISTSATTETFHSLSSNLSTSQSRDLHTSPDLPSSISDCTTRQEVAVYLQLSSVHCASSHEELRWIWSAMPFASWCISAEFIRAMVPGCIHFPEKLSSSQSTPCLFCLPMTPSAIRA